MLISTARGLATWALVRISPSEVRMTPEPMLASMRLAPSSSTTCSTLIRTTAVEQLVEAAAHRGGRRRRGEQAPRQQAGGRQTAEGKRED